MKWFHNLTIHFFLHKNQRKFYWHIRFRMLAAFVKQYQKRLLKKKKKLSKQAIKKTVARIRTATVARALTVENPVRARVLCTLMEVPGSLTFGFMIIIIIVKHGVTVAAECCQGKNSSPESVIKKTSSPPYTIRDHSPSASNEHDLSVVKCVIQTQK